MKATFECPAESAGDRLNMAVLRHLGFRSNKANRPGLRQRYKHLLPNIATSGHVIS